jgi:hypothetical protein
MKAIEAASVGGLFQLDAAALGWQRTGIATPASRVVAAIGGSPQSGAHQRPP